MGVKNFKDLIVWKKSMDLTVSVYKVVKELPREELYSLSDQIRRSAVSIPSNIAEGQQRNSLNEFIHFLYISKGSIGELETQLMLCERLNYLKSENIQLLMEQSTEIVKMLNGLINHLEQQKQKNSSDH